MPGTAHTNHYWRDCRECAGVASRRREGAAGITPRWRAASLKQGWHRDYASQAEARRDVWRTALPADVLPAETLELGAGQLSPAEFARQSPFKPAPVQA